MSDLLTECTLSFSGKLCSIQFAFNCSYIALPKPKYGIGLWKLQTGNESESATLSPCVPLEGGHYNDISALMFSNSEPLLLCSCSLDYIVVWHVENVILSHDLGKETRGRVIGEGLGPVQYCSFSPDDAEVVVCVESLIYVISQAEGVVATLEGHDSTVTCAKYCPHLSSTVISISVDRTFKVWDIEHGQLLYQSTILCGSPLISLALDHTQPRFSVGTADGQVWIQDLSPDSGFRCVHSINVPKIISDVNKQNQTTSMPSKGPIQISSRPSWHHTTTTPQDDSTDDSTEAGCSVLAMCFTSRYESHDTELSALGWQSHHSSHATEAVARQSYLHIGTTSSLLQLNADTLQLCNHTLLQDRVDDESQSSASSAASMQLYPTQHNNIWCLIERLFDNKVDVVRWEPHDVNSSPTKPSVVPSMSLHEKTMELSVLSSEPLLENSPLKAVLIPKKKATTSSKGEITAYLDLTFVGMGVSQQLLIHISSGSQKTNSKTNCIKDQPLTFHPKVKSSGYTAVPRRGMFHPDTGRSKPRPLLKRGSSDGISQLSVNDTYPTTSPHPSQVLAKVSVSDHPCTVPCISISGNGRHLACALSNHTAQVYKLPLSNKSTSYTGHKGAVDWVSWSHDNHKFITSSNDNTALVWVKRQPEPVLCLDSVQGNVGPLVAKTKKTDAFKYGVKFAQFYYIDQFIFLVHGNTIHLYKYSIDGDTKDDIKRYISKSHYKSVIQLELSQVKQVTAFTAINSFYSYIALAAGSDRSVNVYDMNKGQVVRQTPDVHSRPCHAIAINQGSSSISHAAASYNLYVTSAITDGIKLWDLRTDRCVQKYETHSNRSHHCGLSLSACARFLATGADDKSVYIYDLRGGVHLEKLTGHTDVVSAVQFSPHSTNLISATLDGVVREYGPVK